MAANNSVFNTQSIPIFNGTNYQFWSVKMKTLFKSQDLWDLVDVGFEGLADPEQATRLTAAQRNELKEKQKKDAKALFIIQQGVDDALFPRVMGAQTSKEAWDLLQEHYQGSSKVITVKLQSLRREFETMMMKPTESVQDFSVKISALVNQMRSLGEELPEQKIVEKVLRSLPPKFDHVVAAIEESGCPRKVEKMHLPVIYSYTWCMLSVHLFGFLSHRNDVHTLYDFLFHGQVV